MLSRFLHLLACPEDGGALRLVEGDLTCERCSGHYRVHGDNLVDLVPREPLALPLDGAGPGREYLEAYRRLLAEPFTWKPDARPWGYLPSLSPGHRAFVEQERRLIARLAGERPGLVADVSGGAGNYSLGLAERAELVVHCDLDVNSLNYAVGEAKRRRLRNVLFVRGDYLRLPLSAGKFDVILCTDTLERGRAHEERLLANLSRSLRPGGRMLGDFHHRRLGLLTRRLQFVVAYSETEVRSLAASAGLGVTQLIPFGYLPAGLLFAGALFSLNRLARFVLPPTRLVMVAARLDGERTTAARAGASAGEMR